MVRKGGLEPPRFYPPDPKSGASANSATLARAGLLVYFVCHGAGKIAASGWLVPASTVLIQRSARGMAPTTRPSRDLPPQSPSDSPLPTEAGSAGLRQVPTGLRAQRKLCLNLIDICAARPPSSSERDQAPPCSRQCSVGLFQLMYRISHIQRHLLPHQSLAVQIAATRDQRTAHLRLRGAVLTGRLRVSCAVLPDSQTGTSG